MAVMMSVAKMNGTDWGVGAREYPEMLTSRGSPLSAQSGPPLVPSSPIFALFCRTLPRASLLLRGRPQQLQRRQAPAAIAVGAECQTNAGQVGCVACPARGSPLPARGYDLLPRYPREVARL